jgi:multidrug resistance efflux pump
MPATDNQHINASDLLARIDDRDYRIAADQTQAQFAVARANISTIQAQIDSQREQIKQAQAQLDQALAQLQFAREEEVREGSGRKRRRHRSARATNPLRPAGAAGQYSPSQSCRDRNGAWNKDTSGAARGRLRLVSASAAQLGQAKLNPGYTNIVAAQSGPCSSDIAELETTVQQPGVKALGGVGQQSVGVQLRHQSTPESARPADERLQSQFSATVARAKRPDVNGDRFGCIGALNAARRMYVPVDRQ